MGFTYAVLGGGMQGRIAAFDLAARGDTERVRIVDIAAPGGPLPPKTDEVPVDAVRDRRGLKRALEAASACVVALPGSIARAALPRVVKSGVPTVDMSFTPEVLDPKLDRAAKKAGCCLVRDVGVAPGLSHLLAAEAHEALGGLTSLAVYVGGVPQVPPADPFRHAVYFNALDLIAEYTRPARMRRGGREVAPDPLDPREVERLIDGKLGALEAFPSDGLRTLLTTYPECPEMRELTLRWPGHLEQMRALSRAGKTQGEGALATAADLAQRFPGARFPDWLLMEVQARGPEGSIRSRVLAARTEDITAMARTTAFTATAAAHALAAGTFAEAGLHPPEIMGRVHNLGASVVDDLGERGVRVESALAGRPFEGRPAPSAQLRPA